MVFTLSGFCSLVLWAWLWCCGTMYAWFDVLVRGCDFAVRSRDTQLLKMARMPPQEHWSRGTPFNKCSSRSTYDGIRRPGELDSGT
ncbi:hypothetical protein QBC39DRAFT_800 [Podospora conica]|nr:hypothetical protein QBC39DRAFT_800 [Schizothecium conicum]